MGFSHAIYNPTSKPTPWMNSALGTGRGRYDAEDRGDDRVGVVIDPKPVFTTLRLDATLARELSGLMAQHKVPGLSVAAWRGGQVAWARALGVADAQTQSPVDARTVFAAQSMS